MFGTKSILKHSFHEQRWSTRPQHNCPKAPPFPASAKSPRDQRFPFAEHVVETREREINDSVRIDAPRLFQRLNAILHFSNLIKCK